MYAIRSYYGLARRIAQALLDLGRVAVAGDAVGVHPLGHLGVERALLRRAARAGNPRLRVDDDPPGVDLPRRDQRDQRQLRGGRVAAGVGDEARVRDRRAVDLGEAVDRLGLKLGREMGVAVLV